MYAITATANRTLNGWTSTQQVPTFYLHKNVQGIVSEDHAVRIALDILSVGGPDTTFHVTAVEV